MEVRNRVEELGADAPNERVLQLVDHEPLVVQRDLHEARLVRGECGKRAHVGRRLHHDLVARVDKDLRHEVEGLLRAVGDDDVLWVGLESLLRHEGDEPLLQAGVPATPAVLQRLRATFGEHAADHVEHVLMGEGLHVGHPAGERHDLWAGGHREQGADLRGGHACRPCRVQVGERVDGELGHVCDGSNPPPPERPIDLEPGPGRQSSHGPPAHLRNAPSREGLRSWRGARGAPRLRRRSTRGLVVKPRIVDVDLENLHLTPKECMRSVFWELDEEDPDLDPAFQKEEWFSSTLLEWGRCGKLAIEDEEGLAFSQYAPPTLFPRLGRFRAGRASIDAAYLSYCFVVEGRRRRGLGVELVRAVAGG